MIISNKEMKEIRSSPKVPPKVPPKIPPKIPPKESTLENHSSLCPPLHSSPLDEHSRSSPPEYHSERINSSSNQVPIATTSKELIFLDITDAKEISKSEYEEGLKWKEQVESIDDRERKPQAAINELFQESGEKEKKSSSTGVIDYLKSSASMLTAYRILSMQIARSPFKESKDPSLFNNARTNTRHSVLEESDLDCESLKIMETSMIVEELDEQDFSREFVYDEDLHPIHFLSREEDDDDRLHPSSREEDDQLHSIIREEDEDFIDSGYSSFHLMQEPLAEEWDNLILARYSPTRLRDLYQINEYNDGGYTIYFYMNNVGLWLIHIYIGCSLLILLYARLDRALYLIASFTWEIFVWFGWMYVATMSIYFYSFLVEPFNSFF